MQCINKLYLFSLKLEHKHAVSNYALAAGHISTDREMLFSSLLTLTWGYSRNDSNRFAPSSPTTVPTRPPSLGQKSKSEWRTLSGGDDLNTSDLREVGTCTYQWLLSYFLWYFLWGWSTGTLAAGHISTGRKILFSFNTGIIFNFIFFISAIPRSSWCTEIRLKIKSNM